MATAHYGWYVGNVGGDSNTWGISQNTTVNSQDTIVFGVQNNNIGTSAPAIFSAGSMWLDTSKNPYQLNIYDGSQWVATGLLSTSAHLYTASGVSPYVGDMKFSAQAANHGLWVLCNGQSLDTTTYSGLFAIIGYSFGGTGSNFSAPDLRGQVAGAIGTGTYAGASTRTIGQFVGEEAHTLTIPEIPNHNHPPNPPSTGFAVVRTAQGLGIPGGPDISIDGGTGYTGGGGSHNTMQPTLFVGNYFIYAGM